MDSSNLLENDTLEFGEENVPKGLIRHPLVTISHIVFRIASLVIYILCGFGDSTFIGSFVLIIFLISVDFWTVKNVTGRIMVGLRWWNYIDDEGQSHWVFEARKGSLQALISPVESQIFWGALFATPLIWFILLLIALAKFNLRWMMIVCIALSLSSSNLYGYMRCKIGKSEGVGQTVKNYVGGIAQKQMVTNITSYFSRSRPAPATADTMTV